MTRLPGAAHVLAAWREGVLDNLVEKTLRPLLGQPLSEVGRAANILWIGFGENVSSPTARSPERLLARHRLHISCAFRCEAPGKGILFAQEDMLEDLEPPAMSESRIGQRRTGSFRDQVASFVEESVHGNRKLLRLSADKVGGIELELSGGTYFRCFPNGAGMVEHWRYFQAGEREHFVVLPEGVE